MSTLDLFGAPVPGDRLQLGLDAFLLHRYALPFEDALLAALADIETQAPFRYLTTPGGYTMSVALTNCGSLGWTSDHHGYRYHPINPATQQPWPAMPGIFTRLAHDAAAASGFDHFQPDACLINRYLPGARLSLHQDKDERNFNEPIVSVSLGMSATFLFGGHKRRDKAARVALHHGDVVVWGGRDRLRYHGVMPVADQPHPKLGRQRLNFTLRKAG